ncbi:MAG: hypothetical protein A2469_02830 [Candidatus Magasanikbacteria bacterium RIFOXYC2_FULL_40_16]|uniref:N-acetyltransferase domain-containing protein n=3 Tax=Candidatus Magasanikiibacteriota TaxID=1752731 RepID=A0A1F6NFV4_9BACT|nr:MAG: hypothetical protein A2224_03295 [Candidatus Magasanikbacteria bacterium RIFOXYA2_FULL_40_20]OGH82742.1 MAG: hypothetical protein A2373_04070 [Candidatus Magasanikbacteria bacterium RIFOXYB1_FULL_40_15]OGH86791.1 MAG: hypothetical protein A2301_02485 [Candidatus Magasanikbacteria bacterium RIFOXYB2_FULL_40_13]OGH87173.1 MAG: hypothetical protein A2206_03305 [Candidatus Magasanikbacteria bacterium RIFOXYA1_FULL_40_8]OGH90066.1 MAG: hypothetical protein A2469_02830 [Candidatus Magasanikba
MKMTLVKLKKQHFPLFYKWWNNPVLRKLTSNKFKKITNDEVGEILNKHLYDKDYHDYVIVIDGVSIGHILFHKKKNRKYFEAYIAIGERKYWDKGIGTQSLVKACNIFFRNKPNEDAITIQALVDNHRAIACYKKVGFQKKRIIKCKENSTVLMKLSK